MIDLLAQKHMLAIIRKRPLDINIETVSYCPLKCVFCCNRLHKREYKVMDNELFENIVRQYSQMGGGALSIGANHSDFLTDPLLFDRLKIIEKYDNIWFYGVNPLISCKKYTDKELVYILKHLRYLDISVEGVDRESYRAMSGIDGFEIFREQIHRIKRLVKENNFDIKIQLLFRTNSISDLKRNDFFKELRKMFPVGQIINRYFDWFGSIKQEDLPEGAKLFRPNNVQYNNNCVVSNASLGIEVTGVAVGCACIDWTEKYVIGDCTKNSLKEIWTGKKAVAFRNAFKNGTLPAICKNCGLYSDIGCLRHKKYLNYKPTDGLYYSILGEN